MSEPDLEKLARETLNKLDVYHKDFRIPRTDIILAALQRAVADQVAKHGEQMLALVEASKMHSDELTAKLTAAKETIREEIEQWRALSKVKPTDFRMFANMHADRLERELNPNEKERE